LVFSRIVFNPSYTVDLRARLLGTATTAASSTDLSSTSTSTDLSSTAQQPRKVDEAEFKSKFKKSNFSSSGFSSSGFSSVPASAATKPVEEDEDVDGEAMDEDLDGEAM
jgi:hypothetical protein